MEELFLNGMALLTKYGGDILTNWKRVKSELSTQQDDLISEFDGMMTYSFEELLKKNDYEHINQLILAMLSQWRDQYSMDIDYSQVIYLLSAIENMIHHILEEQENPSIIDHQSIQYIFNKLLDQVLIPLTTETSGHKWLDTMITSNIIPLHWAALLRIDDFEYKLIELRSVDSTKETKSIIEICMTMSAHTAEQLSLALCRLMNPGETQPRVIPISFAKETLLLCLKSTDASSISSQRIELISNMYKRQIKMNTLESENEWKDAALLYTLRLLMAQTCSDTLKTVADGFVDYLSYKRSALFLYSPKVESAIFAAHKNLGKDVQNIKVEFSEVAFLKKHLQKILQSKPVYLEEAAEHIPRRLADEYQLASLVAVPIFTPRKGRLLGMVLLDQDGEWFEEPKPNQQAMLMKFGHYAGEALYKQWGSIIQQLDVGSPLLTPREKDVLKLMAQGETIQCAAEHLHLSPYTVRDYVAAIIKKLKVKNRTEAVVKAIRMNLIE
ncbi:LuxR C-terminal-related transcriptional regulator [Fictibacillus sp. KIGAM418]|uniref:LuxR C-terminal-related transcriptional regulator n=1 Tax=Fictibacillus marinisediminis TaxID=2878389 RepID=A0A9X1XBQ7_9BACL|nr:LuxR C-terminal-related transcriptional regulator [Fictibacillus marinisediminis]MCK6256080.1 LuxR C-terminal-related transcriptional regulator [Fictibacillus marinisediminis]